MVFESRLDRAVEERAKAVERLNKLEALKTSRDSDFVRITEENRFLSKRVTELAEANERLMSKYETEVEELNIKLAV